MGAGASAGPMPPHPVAVNAIPELSDMQTTTEVECEGDAVDAHLRHLDKLAAMCKLTGRYGEAAAAESRAQELRVSRGDAMRCALLQTHAAQLTAAAALHEQVGILVCTSGKQQAY